LNNKDLKRPLNSGIVPGLVVFAFCTNSQKSEFSELFALCFFKDNVNIGILSIAITIINKNSAKPANPLFSMLSRLWLVDK
jgi:hypothetical protein